MLALACFVPCEAVIAWLSLFVLLCAPEGLQLDTSVDGPSMLTESQRLDTVAKLLAVNVCESRCTGRFVMDLNVMYVCAAR